MTKRTPSSKQKTKKFNSTQLIIDNQNATSFVGVSIIERLAQRLSIWEELKRLGEAEAQKAFGESFCQMSRKVLRRMPVEQLQGDYGFIRLFGNGTLLEGSTRREGTKAIKEKGEGLMWGTWMLGSLVVGQHLCEEGEGESYALRSQLSNVLENVVDKIGRRKEILTLMDSLHGDDPTLQQLDAESLLYIIGANKLRAVQTRMEELPAVVWEDVPENKRRRGLEVEQVCLAYVQCENWASKRLIVCKRYKREGELLWNYTAVFSNIPASRLGLDSKHQIKYMTEIWCLYATKMGEENGFKDLLIDLSCTTIKRNRGYYALLTLVSGVK